MLGAGPSTLARWERGERAPEGGFLNRVTRFLIQDEEPSIGARRAG